MKAKFKKIFSPVENRGPIGLCNSKKCKGNSARMARKILKAVVDKDCETARQSMIEYLKIAELHAEKMLNIS